MSEQTVLPTRISEKAENFQSVFDLAMRAGAGIESSAIEVAEARNMAYAAAVATRALETDLKSRLVEHRLRARSVSTPSLGAPQAA